MDRVDAIAKAAEQERQRRQAQGLAAQASGPQDTRGQSVRAQPTCEAPTRSDTQQPWGCTDGYTGAVPNDRERELALRTMNAHNRGANTTAELIISFARALATYRGELLLDPKDRYELRKGAP